MAVSDADTATEPGASTENAPASRRYAGQFRPGQSGNPAGKAKLAGDALKLQQSMRELGPAAVQVIKMCMRSSND
jgi:hypothetical protein